MDGLSPEVECGGKELDNLLLFIAYLYSFKVVAGQLVYDILQRLATGFSDKEVCCVSYD